MEHRHPQIDRLQDLAGRWNIAFWRLLIFYVGAIAVLVTVFPWTDLNGNGSPFVTAFTKIGIPAAATSASYRHRAGVRTLRSMVRNSPGRRPWYRSGRGWISGHPPCF